MKNDNDHQTFKLIKRILSIYFLFNIRKKIHESKEKNFKASGSAKGRTPC